MIIELLLFQIDSEVIKQGEKAIVAFFFYIVDMDITLDDCCCCLDIDTRQAKCTRAYFIRCPSYESLCFLLLHHLHFKLNLLNNKRRNL